MSNDPKQDRVSALTGTEAKTPLERARQIQEMQRAMEAQQPQAQTFDSAQHAQQAQSAQSAQAATQAQVAQAAHAVFDPRPVTAAEQVLKQPPANPAEQAAYGKVQKDPAALFGQKGAQIEITGNPWKVISFADAVPGLLDLKKPLADYDVKVPEEAVKLKEGALFNLSVTPKAAGSSEPAQKKAVLVDNQGRLKGAEFGNKDALQKALTSIPSFAQSVFQAVFGEGVLKDEPKNLKVKNVAVGSRSAYEVTLERKNEVDGKWRTETATLNNFGLKVPPSSDPKRFDIIVANYYLDGFQA